MRPVIRTALIATGLVAALGSAARADQAPTAAPPASATAVKPEDRIICKRVDVSGTRIQLPKKCMTKKDWDSLSGRGKEDMDAAVRASLARNAVGGT